MHPSDLGSIGSITSAAVGLSDTQLLQLIGNLEAEKARRAAAARKTLEVLSGIAVKTPTL